MHLSPGEEGVILDMPGAVTSYCIQNLGCCISGQSKFHYDTVGCAPVSDLLGCFWVPFRVRAKQWAVVFMASLLFHVWDLLIMNGLGCVVLLNAEF